MEGKGKEKVSVDMYTPPTKKSKWKRILAITLIAIALVLLLGSFIAGIFMADEVREFRKDLGQAISGEKEAVKLEKDTDTNVDDNSEPEIKVVERVVEVEKDMDWYIYENSHLFGGITFMYPEVFQVDVDFVGEEQHIVVTANVKDEGSDKAISTNILTFTPELSAMTYSPGSPKSVNPTAFPAIVILGKSRNSQMYEMGEGSMGHTYFNRNYNFEIGERFFARVDSVTQTAEPYCIEDTTDCSTDEYEYITPSVYLDYVRELLESLEALE